jgi:hypothetical protein
MHTPPVGQRFSSERQPSHKGRTPTAFVRKILAERDESGKENRERMVRHMIEVATRWEVRVIGSDSDGELLKVASGKDAVAAAKLLMLYDLGKPPDSSLAIAEHYRKVETDRFAYALQLLGERAKAMSDKEKAEFFNSLLVAQRGSVEMFIRMAEAGGEADDHAQEQITDGQACPLPDSDPTPAPSPTSNDESESKP